jgi:hypothetical protein
MENLSQKEEEELGNDEQRNDEPEQLTADQLTESFQTEDAPPQSLAIPTVSSTDEQPAAEDNDEDSGDDTTDQNNLNDSGNTVLVPEQNLIESRIDLTEQLTTPLAVTTDSQQLISESTLVISQNENMTEEQPVSSQPNETEQNASSQENVAADGAGQESVFISRSDLESPPLLLQHDETSGTTGQPLVNNDSRVTPVDEVDRLLKHDYDNVSKSQIDEAMGKEMAEKYDDCECFFFFSKIEV